MSASGDIAWESVVREEWCSVLGVEEARDDDDFFALGGHSLLLVDLVERLAMTIGVQVPLRPFFVAPTLENLLALCRQEVAA